MNLVLIPRFLDEPISPLAGSLLKEVIEDGAHHGLVDLVLEEAHRWLGTNEATFFDVVAERAPWWAPDALNERVIHRLHTELLAWIEDIRDDPYHRSRLALDRLLRELADDLLHDPTPRRGWSASRSASSATRRSRRRSSRCGTPCAAPSSPRSRTATGSCCAAGSPRSSRSASGSERRGAARQGRRAGRRARGLPRGALRQRAHLGHHPTIDQWDGQEASRRIELHVGKDLQFIRINGTIVGGLVGVVIHAVSVTLA